MKSVIQWFKHIAEIAGQIVPVFAVALAAGCWSVCAGQGYSDVNTSYMSAPSVPEVPQDGGVYSDYSAMAPQASQAKGPVEKRGDYYVRTTDRYGNPKSDLDQYSPGMLPQPMGALPNSGPEKIDPRTLQPSGFKGAAGDTPLNSVGCQICGEGYGNPRLWTFEAGVRLLHREAPEGLEDVLGICWQLSDITTPTSQFILRDEVFDITPAMQLTATRYLGRDVKNNNYFLEFTYDGLAEWELTNKYTLYGYKTETNDGGETENVWTTEDYSYYIRSRFNTLELNLRIAPRGNLHDRMVYQPNGRVQRQCHPGWSSNLLVGLRYVSQNDYGILSNLTAGNTLSCETDNNMLGFQIGGELIDKHCLWNWGVNWKVAPLYNWADRTFKVNGIEFKASEGQLAGFADIGLWADYKFGKHWKARFQYDVMWVTGVAQATRQITQGIDGRYLQIDNDTTEFMQGLTLSVEYGW